MVSRNEPPRADREPDGAVPQAAERVDGGGAVRDDKKISDVEVERLLAEAEKVLETGTLSVPDSIAMWKGLPALIREVREMRALRESVQSFLDAAVEERGVIMVDRVIADRLFDLMQTTTAEPAP